MLKFIYEGTTKVSLRFRVNNLADFAGYKTKILNRCDHTVLFVMTKHKTVGFDSVREVKFTIVLINVIL